MPTEFRRGCLTFRYPENWTIEQEDTESGWTVSLFSPGTAFVLVTQDGEFPDCDEMLDTVQEVLRTDYADFEAEGAAEEIAGRRAVGHDMSFISLDLTNTCRTRSFDTPEGTVLILCQSADLELEQYDPVLRAICSSMQVEE